MCTANQLRSLIFTNLPHELEQHIFYYRREIINTRKQCITQSSDYELLTELYNRNNKVLYSNTFPPSWSYQFKRGLNIITNEEMPQQPWTLAVSKLNETINICLLLNQCNSDTIIGMQYINIQNVIELLDIYFKTNACIDYIDTNIKRFWLCSDEISKYAVVHSIFDKIKYDYIRTQSIINTSLNNRNLICNIYTHLRLWYINKK